MKKEIESLSRIRDDNLRKAGGHQANMERLEKQLESKQAELETLFDRVKMLEEKAKSGEMYKIKYNNVRTYLRHALYQSGQMSIDTRSGVTEWGSGRFNFFVKIIKDLGLDEQEFGDG